LPISPVGIRPYLVAVFFAMFGIGAAAKVASTLAMINDHSSLSNRAQLMAFFDLVTFGGLVGGFGAGFLALNAFGTDAAFVLLVGGLGVTASVALVYFLVRETPFVPEQRGTWDLLRAVLANPDIRRLLPVYIPVVALYGYVISFTDKLIGVQSGAAQVGKLIVVVAAIGAPLAASLIVGGRISDRARMRRPFMALGLACFGGLAIVISFGPTVDELYGRWPLVAVLAAGAGAFPPAALAYLGDIVQHSVTGTTFGIYSIIFGSGLIVGPILGGALTSALGSLASAVIALDPIAYFAMGGFALFFGLFFVVLLYDIPLFLYLCGPITIIPGVIAIAIGVRQWRRERTVVEFASWAKSQRRIKMDLMAQRLGKTRFETEKLLGKALDEGLVKGAIDRTSDEFVSQDAVKQE